eukprot:6160075-Pyramimonas_sp.AAC.1
MYLSINYCVVIYARGPASIRRRPGDGRANHPPRHPRSLRRSCAVSPRPGSSALEHQPPTYWGSRAEISQTSDRVGIGAVGAPPPPHPLPRLPPFPRAGEADGAGVPADRAGHPGVRRAARRGRGVGAAGAAGANRTVRRVGQLPEAAGHHRARRLLRAPAQQGGAPHERGGARPDRDGLHAPVRVPGRLLIPLAARAVRGLAQAHRPAPALHPRAGRRPSRALDVGRVVVDADARTHARTEVAPEPVGRRRQAPAYDRIHESNGTSPSPDDNRARFAWEIRFCFWKAKKGLFPFDFCFPISENHFEKCFRNTIFTAFSCCSSAYKNELDK